MISYKSTKCPKVQRDSFISNFTQKSQSFQMNEQIIEIQESEEEEMISEKLINEMKILIIKTVKNAKKGDKFLSDVSSQLKTAINRELPSPEPALIIVHYLIEKMNDMPKVNFKTYKAYEMVAQFFRELTVPFNKGIEEQFKQIIKNMLEPSHNAVIVSNLWRERTMNYDCYCFKTELLVRQQLCYRCGRKCHVDCFWPKEKTQKYFECPVCFLINCFPHKAVNEVFFLGYLGHKAKENVEYRMKFYIDMNQENLNNVEVRCIRLNKEDRFQITFPDQCFLKISNKSIKDIEPLPPTSPLKRRNEEQVTIDTCLLTYLNTLYLYQKNEFSQRKTTHQDNHLIMIASTTPRSIPRLLARSLQKQKLSYEDSKEMLRNYMSHPSNDCLIEKLNVSMRCQYYSTRIVIPARSIQCTTHYQPFDLANFVQASLTAKSSVQSWRCPICKKRAYDLIVDQYLLKLIQTHGDIIEITFNNQGEPISIEKESQLTDTEDFSVQNESINKEGNIYKKDIQKSSLNQEVRLPEEPPSKNMNSEPKQERNPVVIDIEESQESGQSLKRTFEDKQACESQVVQISQKGTKIIYSQESENKKGSKHCSGKDLSETKRAELQEEIPWKTLKQKVNPLEQNKTNSQFSISINVKPTNSSKSQQKEIQSDDEVVQNADMKKIQERLVNSHRELLEEAKKELKKGKLSKMEQNYFNALCRELMNLKNNQTQ